ncbi:MAG: hypothetical protein H8E66_30175, partial [Planctomycetes bacterium]|nr:hypothetical protein [Planctomycetota bacterium]
VDSTTAQVTVNNIDPTVTITSITPIDSVSEDEGGVDGRLDETEGFVVKGTVTDPGILDTFPVTNLEVDLNFDGDVNDTGETVPIPLTQISPGNYTFEQTFSQVQDDGRWTDSAGNPAWNNETASDKLAVAVKVEDDDTGQGSASEDTFVHNVEATFGDDVGLTYELDANGFLTSATVLGSIVEPGVEDFHRVSVLWGDGGVGDGYVNPIELAPGELSFEIKRVFSGGTPITLADLYPLTVTVRDDDSGTNTVALQRPNGECMVTGFAVYNVGSDRRAIDQAEKAQGVPYFGDGLMVKTVAEGTGNVNRCIFARTVKSSTWRTEFGKKVVLRDDQQPKPDGPATTPAKPNGSNLPGAGVRILGGNRWRYDDVDIPSFGIPAQTIPGGKEATYNFKISNIPGQLFVNASWSLKIDIDATGKVAMTPTPSGKAPVAKPTVIPVVKP